MGIFLKNKGTPDLSKYVPSIRQLLGALHPISYWMSLHAHGTGHTFQRLSKRTNQFVRFYSIKKIEKSTYVSHILREQKKGLKE